MLGNFESEATPTLNCFGKEATEIMRYTSHRNKQTKLTWINISTPIRSVGEVHNNKNCLYLLNLRFIASATHSVKRTALNVLAYGGYMQKTSFIPPYIHDKCP